MNKNTEQSKAGTSIQKKEPEYLKGSKAMNDLVGQAFVSFTKKPKPGTKSS